MSYSVENRSLQGGASWEVGGSLTISGELDVAKGQTSTVRCVSVALSADTGAGGVLAWANPESVPILVHSIALDVTTEATGAATVDVGVAANATTSSDTLIDGGDIGAAAVVLSSQNDAGTNGGGHRKMSASQYITATGGSDPAGLVGTAVITYSNLA